MLSRRSAKGTTEINLADALQIYTVSLIGVFSIAQRVQAVKDQAVKVRKFSFPKTLTRSPHLWVAQQKCGDPYPQGIICKLGHLDITLVHKTVVFFVKTLTKTTDW